MSLDEARKILDIEQASAWEVVEKVRTIYAALLSCNHCQACRYSCGLCISNASCNPLGLRMFATALHALSQRMASGFPTRSECFSAFSALP